jgi:hypothetical protein
LRADNGTLHVPNGHLVIVRNASQECTATQIGELSVQESVRSAHQSGSDGG